MKDEPAYAQGSTAVSLELGAAALRQLQLNLDLWNRF
jgi:hypothetical protein